MPRYKLAVLFGALPLLWSALALPAASAAPILYYDELFGYTKTTIQYGTGISKGVAIPLLADVYQPVDIGLAPVPNDRPALVIQDGGAWTSARRDRTRVTDPAIYSAKLGYTVVVTDYRQGAPGLPFGLADPGPHAPVAVGQTQFGAAPYAGITAGTIYGIYPGLNPIRAGVEDFAVAIDWTRTNAATLNINPDKIAIAGGSAGGIDALLLQYNNNNVANDGLVTVDPRYAAQAVIALVATMDGNHNRIQAGGPPVFLLNNTADVVVPWSAAMSNRFEELGIYREQWFQPTDATYHGVDWDLDLGGLNLRERVRDFLYVSMIVPEPSSFALASIGIIAIGAVPLRRRYALRSKNAAEQPS